MSFSSELTIVSLLDLDGFAEEESFGDFLVGGGEQALKRALGNAHLPSRLGLIKAFNIFKA